MMTGKSIYNAEIIEIMKGEKQNTYEVLDFCMHVIQNENLWVYNLFTKETAESQKAITWGAPTTQVAVILKHIDKVDLFEKVAKINGAKLIFENLKDENFELKNAKKLKKSIGVSQEATLFLKREKMEELLPQMQIIFSSGENDGKLFIEYLRAIKKLSKFDKYHLHSFIKDFATIVNEGYRTRKVLNYLVKENYYFGSLSIPAFFTAELKDSIVMAKQNGLKMDKFPTNIVKYHSILSANCNIMNNSRAEEFETATSMYNRLEDNNDKTYVITVPKNEQELLEEGNLLHHCVASYRDKIIDDKAIVLFVRKKDDPDSPFVTVEIDDDLNFIQIKEKFDADVTDPDVLDYLKKWRLSKRYLVEGGKSIFKAPNTGMTKKAQKEALKAEAGI